MDRPLIGMCQTCSERRRVVRHAQLGLHAVRTCRWLHDERLFRTVIRTSCCGTIRCRRGTLGVLRRVRIRSFNLHEAFRTDGLIAASRSVQVGWIVQEANGTLGRILVQNRIDRPTIDG